MRVAGCLSACLAAVVSLMPAQEKAEVHAMSISEAVERATRTFPSVHASMEQVNAAAAGIRLARTNYLPSVNALAQENRATRNNVFGLLLPQTVIPTISGPVLGTNNGTTVWGSAVGVLVSWVPFDFGVRRAEVESAEATRLRAQRSLKRTEFDVAMSTAAAFLTLLASEQTVTAAQATVDRAQTVVTTVGAYVKAQLRPGADLSRADSELDAAQTQLFEAQKSVGIARAALAEYTGLDIAATEAAPGRLLNMPKDTATGVIEVGNHPAAQEQNAVVQESAARLKVLQQSYRPTFDLQVETSARGTGALTNGATLGGANGLAPTYFNAAAGLTVTFPILSIASLRAQEAQESALERSASATYDRVLLDLRAQLEAARITLAQSRKIAAETPKEVSDTRAGFDQANARYRAGLSSIVEFAEAQRLLAQAEIDDSLAKLAVWRALLQVESTSGSISGFLAEANK